MKYAARKLAGICTRRGCAEPACDDHCLCARHRDEHRERNRAAMGGLRRWRAAQLDLLSTSASREK